MQTSSLLTGPETSGPSFSRENMAKRAINGIAPFAGAKRSTSPQIGKELIFPGVRSRFDLFCGSLGTTMSLPQVAHQTAVDHFGFLTNLALVLSSENTARELHRQVEDIIVSDAVYENACKALQAFGNDLPENHPISVPAAVSYFIVSWLGRSGHAGTTADQSGMSPRWKTTGGSAVARWRSAVDSVPTWHQILKNWQIIRGCAIAAAWKIEDKDGTVILADPPYWQKAFKYRYDFRTSIPDSANVMERKFGDHGRLAEALNRFEKTKVVVCYYDVPELNEMYPKKKWRRVVISAAKKMPNATSRDVKVGKTQAPEIILVNKP